jgi:hypothetical protein
MNLTHEEKIEYICQRLVKIFKLDGFTFKTMRRQLDSNGKGKLNLKKSYTLAYTSLKDKSITIDIYTPRHRKPKSIKSILNILAHEIAHHQKPPYYQIYKGKRIVRQHYPAFYRQVTKNITKINKDKFLQKFI